MGPLVRDFPLFPLGLVALPTELVPLHIFEERYKTMMARVLEEEGEFGIVWVSDDGLRPIGCACEVAEVLERMPDGRLNLVARGTRAFRIERRQDELAYPAGVVEFLEDRPEDPDDDAAAAAHAIYADLVAQATDRTPDADEVGAMSAYEMAATVDFGLEAKQGLLDEVRVGDVRAGGGLRVGDLVAVVEELNGARRVRQILLAPLDPEHPRPAREEVDAPVRQPLEHLGDLAGAADRSQPVLGQPHDPELGLLVEALPDHRLVALLEDVQRDQLTRKRDEPQWKQRKVPDQLHTLESRPASRGAPPA